MSARDDAYAHVPLGFENAASAHAIQRATGVWAVNTFRERLKDLANEGKIMRRWQFVDTEGKGCGPKLYWREGE